MGQYNSVGLQRKADRRSMAAWQCKVTVKEVTEGFWRHLEGCSDDDVIDWLTELHD